MSRSLSKEESFSWCRGAMPSFSRRMAARSPWPRRPEYQQFKLADGRSYSEMGPDTVVLLLDGITGQEHHKILVKQASNVEAVAFSPDGKTMAVGRGWNDRRYSSL